MTRIVCHTAVPDAKRALAATMDGLSGLSQEYSVELQSIPGGASASWDTTNGYNGKWWGASQALAPEIAQPMLASGYALETESWFAALWEGGTLIQHNLPAAPADSSFEAFLVAAGLEKVVQGV